VHGNVQQKTGYWLSKNKPLYRWQKDYYDHIIRDDDDVNAQICYILLNPVRAGIISSRKNYPHRGSTIYNNDEWEESIAT
jgi:hypothetical protein